VIVIASQHRKIQLQTPPPAGSQAQVLCVPTGATDQQVLAWAEECLEPDAYAELHAILQPARELEPAR